MQIENFKIFIDLVETKSFSKSAELNGISQAAVSQQTRAMERQFDAILIDRSQKQFHLTAEGKRVYATAKEVQRRYEKLLGELQDMKNVISGTIRISTIYSVGLYHLPPYIKKYNHDFPSVEVNVDYRRANSVYEDILQNSADFGFVAFPEKGPQIDIIPFRTDPFVLITHPSHPLGRKKNVKPAMLVGYKFISFDPKSPTGLQVENILRENKIEIDSVMRFDNVETVKRAVEIDAGISIVPQSTVVDEIKQGSLVAARFTGRKYTRQLAILHRKGRTLMPAMKKFIETLAIDLAADENI